MGEQIRIGSAASILGVSVDTLRRWEKDGRVKFSRSAGGQRTIDVDSLRDLLRERAPQTGVSARNQLEGTVVAVEKDGLMAKIELSCGPYRMVSIITREAAEELDLKPGDTATAVVKSTSVEIRR
ncbi:MAG: TOBE domain-containing protein [Actinobacteria bacterium]|nr:TOBE domain-containing protein [Actinomycetota bacterium]